MKINLSEYQLYNYDEYEQYFQQIIDGNIQPAYWQTNTEARVGYTLKNMRVQNRILDDIEIEKKLYNQLSDLEEDWVWLVITEPWCNDSAYNLPVLYAVSECSEKMEFQIALRDDNPALMDRFLTNGGRAIPKLICLQKDSGEVMGSWGPRPMPIQEFVMQQKDSATMDVQEKLKTIQKMYIRDKNKTLQLELIDLVKEWKNHG